MKFNLNKKNFVLIYDFEIKKLKCINKYIIIK